MSVIVNIVLFCAHLCVLCSGYELSANNGHSYKFHTHAASWPDANRTCVAEGARLAVPNSADEEKVLRELFERYPDEAIHDAYRTFRMHVGIYLQDGAWRTVDGQTLAQAGHMNWMPGQPAYEYSLHYGAIDRDGSLSNWSGSTKYAFICEMA